MGIFDPDDAINSPNREHWTYAQLRQPACRK
jgi:hypothetical protein